MGRRLPLPDFTSCKRIGVRLNALQCTKNPSPVTRWMDYWGTLIIEKNMILEVPYYGKTLKDD